MRFSYYFYGRKFRYEPNAIDIDEKLKEILIEEFKAHQEIELNSENIEGAKKLASFVIDILDLKDELTECYRNELTEAFEEEAYEAYEEAMEYKDEEDDWYGTKSDVLGVDKYV